jgi:hypothetical protein
LNSRIIGKEPELAKLHPQLPDIAKGKTPSIPLSPLILDDRTLDLYEILQNISNSRKHRFESVDAQSSKEQESKGP